MCPLRTHNVAEGLPLRGVRVLAPSRRSEPTREVSSLAVEENDMMGGENVSVECFWGNCDGCDGRVAGSGSDECQHACHEEN